MKPHATASSPCRRCHTSAPVSSTHTVRMHIASGVNPPVKGLSQCTDWFHKHGANVSSDPRFGSWSCRHSAASALSACEMPLTLSRTRVLSAAASRRPKRASNLSGCHRMSSTRSRFRFSSLPARSPVAQIGLIKKCRCASTECSACRAG